MGGGVHQGERAGQSLGFGFGFGHGHVTGKNAFAKASLHCDDCDEEGGMQAERIERVVLGLGHRQIFDGNVFENVLQIILDVSCEDWNRRRR